MITRCARSFFTAVTLLAVLAGSSALAANSIRHATTRAQLSTGAMATAARRIHRKPGVVVHQRRSRNKAVAASTVLLGDAVVESQSDFLAAGRAEAFELRAEASGLARAVHVYIGGGNAASTVIVGLYSNAGGHAGARLRAASAPVSGAGTWTTLPISKLGLVSGTTYWLAILGEGGTLRYRDRAQGPCVSETSAHANLRIMPLSWKGGTVYADCPVSAYVSTASPPPVNVAPPALAGEATAGQVLSATTGSWKDTPTSYAYQWQECNGLGLGCLNVSEATTSNLTLSPADVGGTVRNVVTATNEGGSNSAASEPSEPITLPPPPAPANTVAPSISGTAQVGDTLTASNGSWTESPTSFAYQWEDCNTAGKACTNVIGATASSYQLASSDAGHTLRVAVTASNEGGSNTAVSEASGVVASEPPPPAPTNTAAPAVSGTAQEGQTLTASNGTWTGNPTSFGYQWQDCSSSGKNCSNISGATASSYQLASGDVGHTVRVVVSATNEGGTTAANSAATATVANSEPPPPAPTNTVLPSVSGSAVEGQAMSATSGTWTGSPTSFSYQWEDCNTSGEGCSNVSGATSSSYKLAAGDVGHTLRVVVTASNAGGSTKASSAATAKVLPLVPNNTVLPSVSGSAVEGHILSASNGTWSGSPTSFSYQWEDCNSSGEGCSNVSGATSSSYKLATGDVGHTLRIVVIASNAGGSGEATSVATAIVTALQSAPSNTALPSVSGSAVEGQTLSASNGTWSGSPMSFSYQWEDCNTSGEGCANIGGATGSNYKLAASDVGHTLRVAVTASNAGGSAEATSAATATVTTPPAGEGLYVSQAGAGSGNGQSCATAHSLAWLDSSSNWGSGSGKVAPGTTVNLCGTLTGQIVAHGSGESGKPITLEFAPSAAIVMPKCPTSGCVDTNGERYLTIRGTSESQRGHIEDTNQGTGKEEGNITDYLVGIYAEGCEGCTFEYLDIENLYVKTSASDPTEAASIEGIRFGGSNITIAHDTFNNVGWALYSNFVANNGPVHIEHNVFTKVGHGFAATSAFYSAQTIVGPIIFAHNEIYDQKPWDSINGVNHQDGLHCFRSADSGTVAPHYDGFYIYDNRIGPETGIYMNSSFYLEGTTGPACADGSSKLWVFDNVTVRNEDPVNGGGQGGLYMGTGEDRAYNNTFIGPEDSEAGGICVAVQNVSEHDRFRNNIVTRCGKLIEGGKSYFAPEGLNHNLYAGGDGNNFVCGGEEQSALSYWRSCTGQDAEATKYESSMAKVKMTQREEDGKLESGMAAEGTGVNLTSECETLPAEVATACEANILGEPRPKTGAWNMGAY
jgi:hypothetical protein